jgi:hypothetical protein
MEREYRIYLCSGERARPLDQAVQDATTEMLRWPNEDYGLDTISASRLLGQCVEYDLGNVFDPVYTTVCKGAASFFVSCVYPAPPRHSESHFVILVFRLTIFLRDALPQTHQRKRPWI